MADDILGRDGRLGGEEREEREREARKKREKSEREAREKREEGDEAEILREREREGERQPGHHRLSQRGNSVREEEKSKTGDEEWKNAADSYWQRSSWPASIDRLESHAASITTKNPVLYVLYVRGEVGWMEGKVGMEVGMDGGGAAAACMHVDSRRTPPDILFVFLCFSFPFSASCSSIQSFIITISTPSPSSSLANSTDVTAAQTPSKRSTR
jgi:hypothetical protein